MNAEHEWVVSKTRRWCLGCEAAQEQHLLDGQLETDWFPPVPGSCPRSTPAATSERRAYLAPVKERPA